MASTQQEDKTKSKESGTSWHIEGKPPRGATKWQILFMTACGNPEAFIKNYPNDLHDDYLWVIANQGYSPLQAFLEKLRSYHPVGAFEKRAHKNCKDVFSNTFGKALCRAGEKFGPVDRYRWGNFELKGGWRDAYTWRANGALKIVPYTPAEKKALCEARDNAKNQAEIQIEDDSNDEQDNVERPSKRLRPTTENCGHTPSQHSERSMHLSSSTTLSNRCLLPYPSSVSQQNPHPVGSSHLSHAPDTQSRPGSGSKIPTLVQYRNRITEPTPSATVASRNNDVRQKRTSKDKIDPLLVALSREPRPLPSIQNIPYQLSQPGRSQVPGEVRNKTDLDGTSSPLHRKGQISIKTTSQEHKLPKYLSMEQHSKTSRCNSHGPDASQKPSRASAPSQPPPSEQITSNDSTLTARSNSRDLKLRKELMHTSRASSKLARTDLAKLEGQKSPAFVDIIKAFEQFRSGNDGIALGLHGHNYLEWSYFQWPSVFADMWKIYVRFVKLLRGHVHFAELIQSYPQYQYLTTVRIRSLSCAEEFHSLVREADRKKRGVDTDEKMRKQLKEWSQDRPYPCNLPPMGPAAARVFVEQPEQELDLEKHCEEFREAAEASEPQGLFLDSFLKQVRGGQRG
jgi:hypothetical protein